MTNSPTDWFSNAHFILYADTSRCPRFNSLLGICSGGLLNLTGLPSLSMHQAPFISWMPLSIFSFECRGTKMQWETWWIWCRVALMKLKRFCISLEPPFTVHCFISWIGLWLQLVLHPDAGEEQHNSGLVDGASEHHYIANAKQC